MFGDALVILLDLTLASIFVMHKRLSQVCPEVHLVNAIFFRDLAVVRVQGIHHREELNDFFLTMGGFFNDFLESGTPFTREGNVTEAPDVDFSTLE